MAQTTEPTIRTRIDGGVGYLTLDAPPVNILSIAVMEEAVPALRKLEQDPRVKVIVLEAAGTRAFSAGAAVGDHTVEKMEAMLSIFNELCVGLVQSPKPTIAAVRRMALGGGCEVVACCDMVVASEKATFGQPEIVLGVYPVIGVALFADIMGPKAAAEMLLSGRTYSAAEADVSIATATGLPVHVAATVTLAPGSVQQGTVDVTVDFSAYGEPVRIQAPGP